MSDYKENKYYYLYFIFFIFFILVDDNIHFFFFFSSRRRHTRWNCDWSSDVCSSDLIAGLAGTTAGWTLAARAQQPTVPMIGFVDAGSADASADNIPQKVVLYEEDPRDS